MTIQFSDIAWSSRSFFISLVKFSYWSKFHVSIITGSEIMAIFFYKGLTRNPEIRNTLVWVLPNIWRLRQVMDTKFSTNVSNRMLLNAAKSQGYSFYCFWVIKGKPTGRGAVKLPPPLPTQIRLKKKLVRILYFRAKQIPHSLKIPTATFIHLFAAWHEVHF